ncbi:aminotransferase [Granulicatella seriolae]|uniref:Aminotransferase n=1 Tax=Granulicatella seriolae TaxID=2967226 RepID=A0ABT1WQ36_9LACT|nr:aminotransferase [Granulicatella seriolae]
MKIKAFGVEEWLNEYETKANYDLAQSTVASMTLEEIIGLDGTSVTDFFEDLGKTKMNYGHIEGSPDFKEQVAALYQNVDVDNILQTNGATGANFLALYALIEPGDHVISVLPTYQQLVDIPRSFGAKVDTVYLSQDSNWELPLTELMALIRPNTKMICLNSANNPTGTLINKTNLQKLVDFVRPFGTYILVDEVYAPFDDADNFVAIADIYDRGISTNSLSKSFSVPGIRIGWTATNKELADLFRKYRDYTLICCGIIDDALAVHILKNKDKIKERNQKIVADNLKILEEWVAQEKRVNLVSPKMVSTSFIQLDIPISSKEFCLQLLEEEGVLLVPGEAYDMKGFARLGYCAQEPVLREGLKRISRLLASYD